MGFTKLDEGIVLSSIWSESLATRVVWVTMLAMSDSNGLVSCSRSGLLRSTNVSKEEFDEAMAILESPDEESRSREYDGRRIKKCDGGWIVLNYRKYRQFTYSGSKEAIKKRRQRDKGGQKGDMSQKGGDISASASASASVNKNHKVSLPEWVPEETFNEYKKMRVKIKKPITDHAVELAIKELEKLKSNGYDPKDVLNQSILNSWQGLFPLREFKSGRVISGEETKEEFDQRMDRLAKKIEAEQKEEAKIL